MNLATLRPRTKRPLGLPVLLFLLLSAAASLTVFPAADARAGNLTLWGDNDSGQKDEPTPLSNCTDYANTYATSFCLLEDGGIKAWGYDSYNQVTDAPTGTGFIDITAACYSALAIDAAGAIVGWGTDEYGELAGIPDAAVNGPFTQISGGCGTVYALNGDGEIFAWGEAYEGMISSTPGGTGYTKVAAMYSYFAMALDATGTITAWGEDEYNQVTNAPAGAGFIDIAVNYYNGVAIQSDGSLVAWGKPGTLIDNLPSGTDYTAVACSYSQDCFALRLDGSIAAWGDDSHGEVTAAPAGTGFTAVYGGYYMGAALSPITPPAGPLPLAVQYDFTAGVADTLGGRDAIALRPRGMQADGYHFRNKRGLVLELCGVTDPAVYAFEIDMTLDEAPGLNDDKWEWQRIWSFDGEVSDDGMYTYEDYFFFYNDSPDLPDKSFTPGTPFTLRMERDASGTFTASLDGTEIWSFIDSDGIAIQSDRKQYNYVFTDDRKSDYVNDDATGVVSEIRVYGNEPASLTCEAQCSDTLKDSVTSLDALLADVAVPADAKKHITRARKQLQTSLAKCGQSWSRPALRALQRAARAIEFAIRRGGDSSALQPIIDDLRDYVRGEAADKIAVAVAYAGPQYLIDKANGLLAKGDAANEDSRKMNYFVMAFKFGTRSAIKAE